MRKTMITGALAAVLFMPGCGAQLEIPQVNNTTVTQIQQLSTELCGFLPLATTVLEIVASFTSVGPSVSVIGQAAKGICAAVTSRGARRGAVSTYRGVVIRGNFVR